MGTADLHADVGVLPVVTGGVEPVHDHILVEAEVVVSHRDHGRSGIEQLDLPAVEVQADRVERCRHGIVRVAHVLFDLGVDAEERQCTDDTVVHTELQHTGGVERCLGIDIEKGELLDGCTVVDYLEFVIHCGQIAKSDIRFGRICLRVPF